MKKIVLFNCLCFAAFWVTAQWTTNGTIIYYNTGNVGIGTSSPSNLLQVQKGIGATIIGGQDYGNFIGSNGNGYELNLQGGIPTTSFGSSGGALRLGGPARGDADINVIQFLQNGTERMRIHNGGNVGIGTATANYKVTLSTGAANDGLWVGGSSGHDFSILGNLTALAWNGLSQANDHLLLWKGPTGPDNVDAGGLVIGPWSGQSSGLRITYNGNVGIGTSNPGPYKLAVEGWLGARKIKVTQASPWSDYVFDNDYRLRTLEEVEKYIQDYKHLPDVPSATEVEKDGIDIGDNQALLLKKIEELTLYAIDQQKQIKEQQKHIVSQQEQVKELKTSVTSSLSSK